MLLARERWSLRRVELVVSRARPGATMLRSDTPGVAGSGSGSASLSPPNILVLEACVVSSCYPKEEETILPNLVKWFQDMSERTFSIWWFTPFTLDADI